MQCCIALGQRTNEFELREGIGCAIHIERRLPIKCKDSQIQWIDNFFAGPSTSPKYGFWIILQVRLACIRNKKNHHFSTIFF